MTLRAKHANTGAEIRHDGQYTTCNIAPEQLQLGIAAGKKQSCGLDGSRRSAGAYDRGPQQMRTPPHGGKVFKHREGLIVRSCSYLTRTELAGFGDSWLGPV